MNRIIKLSNVTKEYLGSSEPALEKINLEISQNETVGIIGENGSGKSTLLKLISGYLKPTKGSIHITQKVESLFDAEIMSVPELSPYKLAKQFLYLKGVKDHINEKINSIEEFCNIGDRFYDPFYTLSLGMKARVQFAIKTSFYSEIVLVDEVLGAGDITTIKRSSDRIKRIAMTSTFICVSHNISQIKYLCKRCIWIKDKKIFRDNNTEDVINEYQKYMEDKIDTIFSGDLIKNEHQEDYKKIYSWINNNLKILKIKNKVEYSEDFYQINSNENQISYKLKDLLGDYPNSFLAFNDSRNTVINCIDNNKIISKMNALSCGEWLLLLNIHEDNTNAKKIVKLTVHKTTNSDPPVIMVPCEISNQSQKSIESWNSTKCY